MEPEDVIIPDEKKPDPEPEQAASASQVQADTTKGLSDEGIELVGSSVALDNEFSKPEETAFDATVPADTSTGTPSESANSATDSAETASEAPKVTPSLSDIPLPPRPSTVQKPPEPIAQPSVPLQQTAPRPTPEAMPNRMANAIPSDARARGIQNDPSIKPIRTFKTDAEEAIKYGGVSKIQIAVAEEKKREAQAGQAPAEKRTSPALYVLLAFMAVIVLGGGWYYWFSTTQGGKASQAQSTPVSIDPIVQYSKASTALIKPGVDPLTQIAASLAQQNPIAGTVGAIAPMSSATSTNMMALSDVLSGTHIPDPLARSLTGEYMVGVYSSSNQSPFIIIKNNYYQNAYSGMLSWEKDMGSDLTPFISVSMPNVTGDDAIDGTFQDAVLENINARVLKDQSGQTLLAYGFADKDTIVITTNETALKYLFDQLLQVRTVQ